MVGWEFPPEHSGGLGVHCFELTTELGRMGHHVKFLSPFPGPFTPVPGVTFETPFGTADSAGSRLPGAYDPALESALFSDSMDAYNAWIAKLKVRARDVDVIHVHDWFGTAGAVKLARRVRRPLVMTIHSTIYDRSLGHADPEILARETLGLREADRVIAVSRHLKQQLVQRYGIPPEKIRVIYNAVRPPERLDRIPRHESIVLYLGRLAAMKNIDTFLRAAARISPEFPNALFVVAGDGPEFPHLLHLAAHLGISDRVFFLGHVTDDERAGLLAGASVFVLPSVVEPFGIAALEAMVAGVPTIVSKTSGVAEISENVFAVDFWDTEEFASRIAELLRYPVLHRVMGDLAQGEALGHGWAERALETVGVYAELAAPGRRDR
jgi:glycogen(starch) synthase